MAQMNFGGVVENVMTREEFPLEKAREILKDETIAVIGYGVQGPGQSLNLRDNGFNVIVGQRQGKTYEKAVEDGWVPGETLFGIEEACDKATIIMCLFRRCRNVCMAYDEALFDSWQGPVFLSWLRDHLERSYRCCSSCGY